MNYYSVYSGVTTVCIVCGNELADINVETLSDPCYHYYTKHGSKESNIWPDLRAQSDPFLSKSDITVTKISFIKYYNAS